MIRYHADLIQGSDEWHQARCGLLTASEMKLIVTSSLKPASNDKERGHLYELLAQRITGFVEPSYISDDMLRGQSDEIMARALYAERYAPVQDMGFVTNDCWGFTLGCSPDGIVGEDGMIECKSRRQKFQVQTVVENLAIDGGETIPAEYVMQIQTSLLVTEREWVDFISYSGGLPMVVIRVWPNEAVQNAIIETAGEFERRLREKMQIYLQATDGLIPTERRIEEEITL